MRLLIAFLILCTPAAAQWVVVPDYAVAYPAQCINGQCPTCPPQYQQPYQIAPQNQQGWGSVNEPKFKPRPTVPPERTPPR